MYGSLVLSFSSFTEEINRLSPFFMPVAAIICSAEYLLLPEAEILSILKKTVSESITPYSDSQNKQ